MLTTLEPYDLPQLFMTWTKFTIAVALDSLMLRVSLAGL